MDFSSILGIAQHLSAAIIVLLAGFLLAKLGGKAVKRILHEAEINRVLEAAGFKPISDPLARLAEYAIYIGAILVALQQLGLTSIVIGIIATLAVIVISLSLILAFRDFIPNAITGLFLRKQLSQHVGTDITIGIVTGTLKRVGLTASVIEHHGTHYVPHLYASRNTITPTPTN